MEQIVEQSCLCHDDQETGREERAIDKLSASKTLPQGPPLWLDPTSWSFYYFPTAFKATTPSRDYFIHEFRVLMTQSSLRSHLWTVSSGCTDCYSLYNGHFLPVSATDLSSDSEPFVDGESCHLSRELGRDTNCKTIAKLYWKKRKEIIRESTARAAVDSYQGGTEILISLFKHNL
jgi:hypothetical protein